MYLEIGSLLTVALLWGATNPLLKRGSAGITKVKADNMLHQFLLEIKYLFTNVQYLVPLCFNQLGSVVYFLALQRVDLSLTVPVTNSLTFVFTALTGWLLGEQPAGKSTYIGMLLVLAGTLLCCQDKFAGPLKKINGGIVV